MAEQTQINVSMSNVETKCIKTTPKNGAIPPAPVSDVLTWTISDPTKATITPSTDPDHRYCLVQGNPAAGASLFNVQAEDSYGNLQKAIITMSDARPVTINMEVVPVSEFPG